MKLIHNTRHSVDLGDDQEFSWILSGSWFSYSSYEFITSIFWIFYYTDWLYFEIDEYWEGVGFAVHLDSLWISTFHFEALQYYFRIGCYRIWRWGTLRRGNEMLIMIAGWKWRLAVDYCIWFSLSTLSIHLSGLCRTPSPICAGRHYFR